MIFIHTKPHPDSQWDERQKGYDRDHLMQSYEYAMKGWRGDYHAFRTAFGVAHTIHDAKLKERAIVGCNRLLRQLNARTMVLIDLIISMAEGATHEQ